jgi:hypothetical protein
VIEVESFIDLKMMIRGGAVEGMPTHKKAYFASRRSSFYPARKILTSGGF